MSASISFFDMSVTITPPNGHLEPLPLLLGANWQPNDVRLLFASASGDGAGGVGLPMVMNPDPPTGFTSTYSLALGRETFGVYFRRLVAGDTDTNVAWEKPPGWRHFNWAPITIRGTDPSADPVAGKFDVSYMAGNTVATIPSVTVPAAGTMIFCLGTVPDPEGSWPSWAVSMGVPIGWTALVASEKSGLTFGPYNTDPGMLVIAKSYTSAGSTGSVSLPVAVGLPAWSGLYAFVRPAPDVTVTVGAA